MFIDLSNNRHLTETKIKHFLINENSKNDKLTLQFITFKRMIKNTTTQFDFEAKPKVTAQKPKYRQPRQSQRLDGTNLMNDPRIIRGNTYAAIVQNQNEIQPPPPKKRPDPIVTKKKHRKINFDTGFEPQTPRAVDGRQHFSIQTEPFVETLRDKPVQYERQCQTDLFLDRPVEREFDPMKQKTGVDRTTQIEQNDPELFDFDYQVQPILQALLSKVVETSRMELYEQKQLEEKQKQKIEYQKRRHAKLSQAQKLQAKELRIKEESERRNLQFQKSDDREAWTQKKLISRILSKQYLKNLKSNTNKILQEQGFFRQPLETELYEVYTPWLYEQILSELKSDQNHRNEVFNMTIEAERDLEAETAKYIQQQKDRRDAIIHKREEEIRLKKEKKQQLKREKEEEEARKRAEQEALKNGEQPAEGAPSS